MIFVLDVRSVPTTIQVFFRCLRNFWSKVEIPYLKGEYRAEIELESYKIIVGINPPTPISISS